MVDLWLKSRPHYHATVAVTSRNSTNKVAHEALLLQCLMGNVLTYFCFLFLAVPVIGA